MSETITPEEIKGIRAQYGLTQKSFALLLGIGTASMVRYEQGQRPSKANANLIRAARHPEFMAECLQRDGGLITEKQRDRAMQCSYAMISLEPASSAAPSAPLQPSEKEKPMNRMTERYHYTLQQEVLNEQAANIMGEIISLQLQDGFSGFASDVFEDLLDQVAALKPSITTMESCDDGVLASIRGYLRCANELLNRQLSEEAA